MEANGHSVGIEEWPLTGLAVLDPKDVRFLEQEYGLTSVGMLLAKTRGLELGKVIEGLEDGQYKLEQLKSRLSEDILKKYRTYRSKRPMGLILEEGHEQE